MVSFGATHFYVSQDDKGGMVMGSDLDGYNSYGQRGDLPIWRSRWRTPRRSSPDVAPARRAPVERGHGHDDGRQPDHLQVVRSKDSYIDGGWCYGGFKATPASGWCFAHTLANDRPHELNSRFTLDRFRRGHQIDEKGWGRRPWAH